MLQGALLFKARSDVEISSDIGRYTPFLSSSLPISRMELKQHSVGSSTNVVSDICYVLNASLALKRG